VEFTHGRPDPDQENFCTGHSKFNELHCEACHDSEHYSTILFGTHARAVIAAHPAQDPLFLYVSVTMRLFVNTCMASGDALMTRGWFVGRSCLARTPTAPPMFRSTTWLPTKKRYRTQ
jgi:hypothetical protein